MPKSEKNSTQKKPTKLNSTTANLDSNIESYVPKITHWTKLKKEKSEEVKNIQEIEEIEKVDTDMQITKKPKLKPEENNAQNVKADSPILQNPKTEQDKNENLEEKNTIAQTSDESKFKQNLRSEAPFIKTHTSEKPSLPSFLNRGFKKTSSEDTLPATNVNQPKSSTSQTFVSNEQNNSLTSIFKRDQDEISNIKRVFRKSIIFLTVSLLSFGLSSLASSSFAFQSVLTLAFTGLGFVALTNVFFIIVAHRTYIWLFLIGQFIILAITQYPYSTNLSTLGVGLVTVLLTYLAYLDLEKVQLGSRLFSIPYIVGESTKILSSVLIFIVCLSTYNQITAKGLDRFAGESVLAVPVVMDRVVLPLYQNVLMKEFPLDISDKGNTTAKDLICAERRITCSSKNNTILAKEEYSKIDKQCQDTKLDEVSCAALKTNAEQSVLESYLNQDLPGTGVTLTTRLDSTNYQPVLSVVIQNKIQKFTDPSKFTFLPSYAPASSLIPFIISLILFILLSIFKFILVWSGYIVTWVLWKLLQITGFVRLDIEMVEAEIVGI